MRSKENPMDMQSMDKIHKSVKISVADIAATQSLSCKTLHCDGHLADMPCITSLGSTCMLHNFLDRHRTCS